MAAAPFTGPNSISGLALAQMLAVQLLRVEDEHAGGHQGGPHSQEGGAGSSGRDAGVEGRVGGGQGAGSGADGAAGAGAGAQRVGQGGSGQAGQQGGPGVQGMLWTHEGGWCWPAVVAEARARAHQEAALVRWGWQAEAAAERVAGTPHVWLRQYCLKVRARVRSVCSSIAHGQCRQMQPAFGCTCCASLVPLARQQCASTLPTVCRPHSCCTRLGA